MNEFLDVFGRKARCRITGFEGVVIGAVVSRRGAPRLCLRGTALHNEVPTGRQWFDEVEVEVDRSPEGVVFEPVECPECPIPLGVEVRDKVTGFRGISDGYLEWATGCVFVSVQPTGVTRDGKKIEAEGFHPSDIEVLAPPAEKPLPAKKTGGPHDFRMSELDRSRG